MDLPWTHYGVIQILYQWIYLMNVFKSKRVCLFFLF